MRAEQAVRAAAGGLLREVLHVGIVVESLERSTAEWERLFRVSAGGLWSGEEAGVRVAFFDIGGTRIELVEYTGPVVERFGPVLARREGVHHICFRVDDLDVALLEMGARGLAPVPGFPVQGAHGRIAFLAPEPSTGLVVELCQLAEPQPVR